MVAVGASRLSPSSIQMGSGGGGEGEASGGIGGAVGVRVSVSGPRGLSGVAGWAKGELGRPGRSWPSWAGGLLGRSPEGVSFPFFSSFFFCFSSFKSI